MDPRFPHEHVPYKGEEDLAWTGWPQEQQQTEGQTWPANPNPYHGYDASVPSTSPYQTSLDPHAQWLQATQAEQAAYGMASSAPPVQPQGLHPRQQSLRSNMMNYAQAPQSNQAVWERYSPETTKQSPLPSPGLDWAAFMSPTTTPRDEDAMTNASFFQDNSASRKQKSTHSGSEDSTTSRRKERAQHNIVEHRYREKLNREISQLRDHVPALREAQNSMSDAPAKVGKSTVLVKAGEYIERLEEENAKLKKRNENLEKLVQRIANEKKH